MPVLKKCLILYYPTGIVHFRNLEVLKKGFREFRFLVLVEPWITESYPAILNKERKEDLIFIKNGRFPQTLWEQGIDMLFLCMAYPNLFRLDLVYGSVKRNIPVISIEEVNQLTLNNFIINHYFLPMDYFGVISGLEKEGFSQIGCMIKKIMVTGWPFYKDSSSRKNGADIRKEYNIPSDKKICLLILGSLKDYDPVSLETKKVRRFIIDMVSRGLLEDYILLIKPHPVERNQGVQLIKQLNPRAKVLDPNLTIEDLLDACDLVVNRGNSQVVLLAMMRNKPVVIIPAGLKTIFHGFLELMVANSVIEFKEIIEGFNQNVKKDYTKIFNRHLPFLGQDALKRVRKLFELALNNTTGQDFEKLIYISILYAFLGDLGSAHEILKNIKNLPDQKKREKLVMLNKLYQRRIEIKDFRNLLGTFQSVVVRWHIQALWVRRLLKCRNKRIQIKGVEDLWDFEGRINPHYFLLDILGRIELEFITGHKNIAEELIVRFSEYKSLVFFREYFSRLNFIYSKSKVFWPFARLLWILLSFNTFKIKGWVKKVIKYRG